MKFTQYGYISIILDLEGKNIYNNIRWSS